MKTIELSAALNNAAVKETLKNFVGVDETGNMGLMTPERLAAVAGGLQFKGDAPLTDDIIPEQGIYVNMDDKYYPRIWSMIVVFKNNNVVTELLINGAFHSVLTRRHNGTSWNEWG